MQPYFAPYLGYWNLLACADKFVLYDNIQFTQRGWITRNRMLLNGAPSTFSLPLKHDREGLHVRDRYLAPDFNREGLLRRIEGAYRKAPQYKAVYSLIASVILYSADNLFDYLHHSILRLADFLEIRTPIVVSSDIPINHALRGQSKVLAICEALGAAQYVNAQGGQALYDPKAFATRGIDLKFIRAKRYEYAQGCAQYVPWLSIVDAMMHLSRERLLWIVHHHFELFDKGESQCL